MDPKCQIKGACSSNDFPNVFKCETCPNSTVSSVCTESQYEIVPDLSDYFLPDNTQYCGETGEVNQSVKLKYANNEPMQTQKQKFKLYQQPPSTNAPKEQRRINALISKENRDEKKREYENLKDTIKDLKLELEKTQSNLDDKHDKIKKLQASIDKSEKAMGDLHQVIEVFGNICLE